jgi:hypothetical protein
MASKNIRTIQHPRVRHVSYRQAGEILNLQRPKLMGKARPVPVQETAAVELSETDVLLHQMHDLVAQLREAVGRPRLDL